MFCDVRSHIPSIACLDFVGTTREVIEAHFRHWASPDAAQQGSDARVQGGHGNGGKCYMTQLFTDHAILHTVRDGLGNKYGVKGGSTQFGYVPNAESGSNYAVKDLRAELNAALQSSAMSVDKLPADAQRVFADARGFTLVRGFGPKNYDRKIRVKELLSQLRDHTQMLTTLAYCTVYVFYNGRLQHDGNPLRPSAIEPIAGAESPRIIPVPDELPDPVDGHVYSTTDKGRVPSGKLILRTSDVSMRWKKKSRHTINYVGVTGFIGYKPMQEFSVQSPYRDKLYGECELNALEPFKQNDRGPLANAPLVRALEQFIAEEVERYALEFEERDKKSYTKQERNALSLMNQALDRWKNNFIKTLVTGAFGPGGGPPPHTPLPGGTPSRLELTVSHPRLGIGVAIRPAIRFYDAQGRQVRGTPFRWVTEDPNIAYVDDDLMLVNSFACGSTVIYAETVDTKLESNRVTIEVVKIRSIEITPHEVDISVGGRTQLSATCTLSNGEAVSDVALVWTESNSSVARVSAVGGVYAASPGIAEVIAGDDRATASSPAVVTVTEMPDDSGGKKGTGGNRGRGYPLILVSGEVDVDPDTSTYVNFSSDMPPICQRPEDVDRNIWWINSAAPLARLYLSKDLGYGYDSREWRMYHLERYTEIITQIALKYDPNISAPMTVSEFFLYVADKSGDIQAAIAHDLREFIHTGVIPEGKW